MAAGISFKRRLLYLAATLFLSTTVAILLAELLLWRLSPTTSACRVPYQQSLPGVSRSIVYERNPWGMRSLSMHSLAKPPQTIRILCLGASTTDQPIQSTPDIWSARLEMALQSRFGSEGFKIEIAAYGRGGERIGRRLEWARRHLGNFDPDIVILLEGINDLCWGDAVGEVRADPPEHVVDPSFFKLVKLEILRRSQIARRLVAVRKNYGLGDFVSGNRALEWHSQRLPEIRRLHGMRPLCERIDRPVDPAVRFRQTLADLIDVIQERGAICIVLGQPTLWKRDMSPAEQEALWFPIRLGTEDLRASPAWLADEMARFNELQRSAAQNAKAIHFPLDARIDKTLDHFVDDCHFTDRGNDAVANAILPEVSAQVERKMAVRSGSPSSLTLANEPSNR